MKKKSKEVLVEHYNRIFCVEDNHIINEFAEAVNLLLYGKTEEEQIEKRFEYIVSLLKKDMKSVREYELLYSMYMTDTIAHSLNVALISHEIAKRMGLSKKECDTATMCGLMHDIGKLAVSDHVLRKSGPLTEKERQEVELHPIKGYEVLLQTKLNTHVRNTALMHHERVDGSGYPYGTNLEHIDIYARIVAIADVYDAMTMDRVYRKALPPAEAMAQIKKDRAKYDPDVYSAFMDYVEEQLHEIAI